MTSESRRFELRASSDVDRPVYVISVAAELAGLHAQTLRQYDRLGLVTPERTGGGGRRYSVRDLERLRQVQELSNEGVSLVGIRRIMELENQVDGLTARLKELKQEAARYREVLENGGVVRRYGDGAERAAVVRSADRPGSKTPGSSLVLYRKRG